MFEEFSEISRLRGMERIKDTTYVRHVLMKEYGWIPEKEFYDHCSIGEILTLLDIIGKERIVEKEEYDKVLAKMKVK